MCVYKAEMSNVYIFDFGMFDLHIIFFYTMYNILLSLFNRTFNLVNLEQVNFE